ncbi:hypothetical protein D3C87_87980 [compost metagenome]
MDLRKLTNDTGLESEIVHKAECFDRDCLAAIIEDMKKLRSLEAAEDFIFSNIEGDLRLATPLGLGKPNQLINRIYETAKKNPKISLKIFTALSLEIPKTGDDLAGRFLKPFLDRHYGKDYPQLTYIQDLKKNQVPSHIQLHEFYFQAGQYLNSETAQRNYISVNYTHAAQVVHDMKINVIVQYVAVSKDGASYSLSCNPDLTLDIVDDYRKKGDPLLMVGVVHPDLPFLGGDAEVKEDFFNALVFAPEITHSLFAVPRAEVDAVDHLIGFHASQIIPDDGTLQIGIGSLGDALVHSTLLRHQNNSLYKKAVETLWKKSEKPMDVDLHHQEFSLGLYATSEMLMDGFMHLRKGGVLKRFIFDHDEKARIYMHGAFYLGSKEFYHWLRSLEGEDYQGLSMTRVSKVNDLYDSHELALRRQRKNARFFNTCMNLTLLGGAASETLEDGRVVSGVGGQYNFVAMAHELSDAHSVLMLRSTRTANGKRNSNIVWSHGQITIPRHLRDIVITEYGIASLRGQCDEEVIRRLIAITDSEFQEELAETAKRNGKLSQSYSVPEKFRHNTPQKIEEFVQDFHSHGIFRSFPFGNDFDPLEQRLLKALRGLKKKSKLSIAGSLLLPTKATKKDYAEELKRMNLWEISSLKEIIYRKLLLNSLAKSHA